MIGRWLDRSEAESDGEVKGNLTTVFEISDFRFEIGEDSLRRFGEGEFKQEEDEGEYQARIFHKER